MRHRFESAVIWHAAQAERCATLAALCVGAARREYLSRAEDHALAAHALCTPCGAGMDRRDVLYLVTLAACIVAAGACLYRAAAAWLA